MKIVSAKGYTVEQCRLMKEILTAGSVVEHHNTAIGNHLIAQMLYRYRGNVYLFIIHNGRVITFEHLKAGEPDAKI